MSASSQRQKMVLEQLVSRGIKDRRVIAAMEQVPREEFVASRFRKYAFRDCALPIEDGQTISQPFTVALMCEALQLTGTEKVLEIGTGSGYGAAVLSRLAKTVHTIERKKGLARTATIRLAKLGFDNVLVHCADGSLGLPSEAPFDAIVATAAPSEVPPPFLNQLKLDGRIVMPIGPRQGQKMYRITRTIDGFEKEYLGGFVFVPLIGAHGHPREIENMERTQEKRG